MVKGTTPTSAQTRLLTAELASSIDFGPQAPSIAAPRMAITCGVGIIIAGATGINFLGDTHGGAGQECVELLDEVRGLELDGLDIENTVNSVVPK